MAETIRVPAVSEAASPPAKPEGARIRRLLEREWLEIVSLAKEGMSVLKIAKIYDVHHTVIYRGLKKRGVRIGSLIAEASEEELERSREETVRRIKETKDTDYRFTEALQKKIMKTVIDAGSTPSKALDDIKALKIAIDGIRSGTNNKWRLLGLDRENEHADAVLPELPIREMTQNEVELIRNRQNLEDGNLSQDDMDTVLGILDDTIPVEDEDDETDGEAEVAF